MITGKCKKCGIEIISGVYCVSCFLKGLKGEFKFKWMSREKHEENKDDSKC